MTRARDLALTVGAVLGVLCLLWTAAVALLGVTPLVLTSGSMEPAIATGDLALARSVPADEVRPADVVSVDVDGTRVTHRVVGIERGPGGAALTLKGDANARPDATTYEVARVDRVFATIPKGGYVLAAVGSPAGLVVGSVLVGGLIVLAFAGRPRQRGGRRRADVAGAAVVLVALGAAGAVAGPAETTQAAFTDEAGLTTGTMSAHTVQRPDSVSCSSLLLSATITWPEKDPRYDYEVVLRRTTSPAGIVSTRQITGSSTSTTYTGLLDFGLGSVLSPVNFVVEVRSKLAGTPGWESSTIRTTSLQVLSLLIVGVTVTCT